MTYGNMRQEVALEMMKLAYGGQPMQPYQVMPGMSVMAPMPSAPAAIAPRSSSVILNALTGATIGSTLGGALAPAFDADPQKAMLLGMAGGALVGAKSGLPPARRPQQYVPMTQHQGVMYG